MWTLLIECSNRLLFQLIKLCAAVEPTKPTSPPSSAGGGGRLRNRCEASKPKNCIFGCIIIQSLIASVKKGTRRDGRRRLIDAEQRQGGIYNVIAAL